MSKELYVGGLPYNVSDGNLKEMFARYGAVESGKVIKGRFTRQSRGYGFVVMSNEEEAEKAVKAINGTQMDGRTLVVRDAHPQMIRKILCPVDFSSESKAGVAYAISLAQQNHAELVFLHVAEIPVSEIHEMAAIFQDSVRHNQASELVVDKLFGQKASKLNNFIGHNFESQLSQLQWRTEVSLGKVANEVVQYAAGNDFDLIVVTKKHRGILSRVFSSSISDALTRMAHCPVVCISDAAKASPWRGRPMEVFDSAHQYS
ncbi:MAG: universal stress protein [Deltaproteobacteria bacterium]|nr:universal stress protein [Deltaproteobacteria bacterium]